MLAAADVCLIIGAEKVGTVIVMKRSMGKGFASI